MRPGYSTIFRKRIYDYLLNSPEKEDLLFGQFINIIKTFDKEAGTWLDKQRTDNMLFKSNIKETLQMSLAYDVRREAIKAMNLDGGFHSQEHHKKQMRKGWV